MGTEVVPPQKCEFYVFFSFSGCFCLTFEMRINFNAHICNFVYICIRGYPKDC
jgi:hypothetical protein